MMALDIRTNTYNYNLPQFFHETIDSTGKIYILSESWDLMFNSDSTLNCALFLCKW